MRVQEIMTGSVRSCTPDTNLAAAATMMWDGDCGAIPVVHDGNKAMGLITDRDICIALATRNRRADEITVGEVIGHELYTCDPDDDVRTALRTMRDRKVHRLPVVNGNSELVGILSLNDLILEAKEGRGRRGSAATYEEIIDTFKSICGHRIDVAAA